MKYLRPTLALLIALSSFSCANSSFGREWTSALGGFKIDAELISFNEKTIVLKKTTGELVAVEVAELSKEDQEYLKSKEAVELEKKSADTMQVWTAKDGMKFRGRVLAYGRKDLVIQRRLGEVLVNDKKFSTLDPLHQTVTLRIVSELEKTKLENAKQLEEWTKTLGSAPKSYVLEGVMFQLENGDEIGLPFFLFAPDELSILEPGWNLWKERTESDEHRESRESRESFLVRSAARAYQRDRIANQQIEMLKLDMLGAISGVTSIWQVGLVPGPGVFGRPISVLVSTYSSENAAEMALQRYPGYVLVAVRKANRY